MAPERSHAPVRGDLPLPVVDVRKRSHEHLVASGLTRVVGEPLAVPGERGRSLVRLPDDQLDRVVVHAGSHGQDIAPPEPTHRSRHPQDHPLAVGAPEPLGHIALEVVDELGLPRTVGPLHPDVVPVRAGGQEGDLASVGGPPRLALHGLVEGEPRVGSAVELLDPDVVPRLGQGSQRQPRTVR